MGDISWLAKCDPIVILQEKKEPEDPWTFIGRTELVKDERSPSYKEKISLVSEIGLSLSYVLKQQILFDPMFSVAKTLSRIA